MKKFYSVLMFLSLIVAFLIAPSPSHAVGPVYQLVSTRPAIVDSIIAPKVWTSYAFLDTVTGYSTTVTDSLYCDRDFRFVTCRAVAATGTSNATAHVIQHLPAALIPAVAQIVTLTQITDTSTVFYSVKATIGTDGIITLTNNGTAFKNSGTFAITAGTRFQYQLR